jgi:hypothetical protein
VTSKLTLGLAALVIGALAAANGSAAVDRLPTLTISPAIVDQVLKFGTALPAITVTNGTTVNFDVKVYPALVTQNLDGSISIKPKRKDLTAAKKLFTLTPAAVVLPAGKQLVVKGRFLRTPAGKPDADAAAVIEATPPTPPHVPPKYRIRLLGALLISKPGAPPPQGRIVLLRAQQAGPRLIRLVARLGNSGRVHGYPQALRLRVLTTDGRTVFTGLPRPGVILPGFRRDYTAMVGRRLTAGKYLFQVTTRFGKKILHKGLRFKLVAPNKLG